MEQETDTMMATRPDPNIPAREDRRRVYDGGKPPHRIEEDIARTRLRLSATIQALEQELRPRRIIEKGAETLRSSPEPGPGAVREQVWAYAIPLALVAAGLGWLFALRRQIRKADLRSAPGEAPIGAVVTDVTETQRIGEKVRESVGPAGFEPATTPL
jgi:uncharacterized protein DUF3618